MSDDDKKIDADYYDKSDYYEENLERFSDLNDPFQRYRIRNILKLYTPQKGETLLDLGCGWGTLSFVLSPYCQRIVGIDFSQKSVDICNRLLQKKNLPNVTFQKADATKTNFPDDTFDVIVSADLFEHIYPQDYELMIAECRRILKKDGKLVIWTPHRGHFLEIMKNNNIIFKKDISHVDYKSMATLTGSIERTGMKVIKSYYASGHVPVVNLLETLFAPIFPFMRRRIAVLAQK